MTWFKLVTRKENVVKYSPFFKGESCEIFSFLKEKVDKYSLYFLKFFNKFLYLYRKPINTTEYDYSEQPSDPPFRNR